MSGESPVEGEDSPVASESAIDSGRASTAGARAEPRRSTGSSVQRPTRRRRARPPIGWREWVTVIGLDGEVSIKAKVDTGARTSALHAFEIQEIDRDGERWVRFEVHPIQRDNQTMSLVEAPLVDERAVRNSGGSVSLRPVVELPVRIGKRSFKIEITLVRRDEMGFRMLLGRQAVRRRFVVDPGRSFLTGGQPMVAVSEEKELSEADGTEVAESASDSLKIPSPRTKIATKTKRGKVEAGPKTAAKASAKTKAKTPARKNAKTPVEAKTKTSLKTKTKTSARKTARAAKKPRTGTSDTKNTEPGAGMSESKKPAKKQAATKKAGEDRKLSAKVAAKSRSTKTSKRRSAS